MPSNAIFISYRRSAGGMTALAVFQDMRANGIDAFYDIESIPSGKWLEVILRQIAARPYFVLILTPGTLDRCAENGDMLRKEIDEAIRLKRVIVPLYTPEFKWDDLKRFAPDVADEISGFNGIEMPHRFFKYALMDVRERYLQPIDIPLAPVPATDNPIIDEKMMGVVSASDVIAKQLTAEEYYGLAEKKWRNKDYDGAITDANNALSIDPNFARAYNGRGSAYRDQGNYDQALLDFSAALQLDAKYAYAYYNRGTIYALKNDYSRAILDKEAFLQLSPNDPTYSPRALKDIQNWRKLIE